MFRSDWANLALCLPMSSPPGEFQLQLDVAFLVDFFKSHVKRPLLDVRPKLKRRVLNDSACVVLDVLQSQNLPQGRYAYSLESDQRVLLGP